LRCEEKGRHKKPAPLPWLDQKDKKKKGSSAILMERSPIECMCVRSETLIHPKQKGVQGREDKKVHQKGSGASQLWYSCRRFKQPAEITRSKKGEKQAAFSPLPLGSMARDTVVKKIL
jgi:hypothetical protein